LRKDGDGRTIEVMSLLAYSVRRAIGALVVLLVVIWLLLLGVYHITGPWFQPALAHEWSRAAQEVAIAALVLLGLGALWRVRKRRTPK
jgi:MYXO-CTERM domain-containing protein